MRAIALLLIVSAFALCACNTVRGMGQDIQAVGNAIQKTTR